MSKLQISVSPEEITSFGSFVVTNSLLTSFIVTFLLITFAIYYSNLNARKKVNSLRHILEMVVEGFYNFFRKIAEDKVDVIFPLLMTLFFFIILGNWVGLLPGVGSIGIFKTFNEEEHFIPIFRSPSADLNTTIALALVSVGVTQYLSIKALGIKGYIKRFINLKNPINFFVGILEIISEFAKILSFSFRLFGNIFAGEVLLSVMVFLIPLFVPVPFLILEVFVGFIQALVFTMLTTIFIVVSVRSGH